MTIQWTLRTYPIKDLKDHPKNPRQISKQQLQHLTDLIDKYGLIDKPIINKDMTIIGGHQRIRILKKKKQKTVECWVPDRMLDEKEVEELLVRHNLNQGSFDYDILADNFEVIDLLQYGFTEAQLLDCYSDENEGECEDSNSSSKKKKLTCCPSCGHEF